MPPPASNSAASPSLPGSAPRRQARQAACKRAALTGLASPLPQQEAAIAALREEVAALERDAMRLAADRDAYFSCFHLVLGQLQVGARGPAKRYRSGLHQQLHPDLSPACCLPRRR